MKKKTEKKTKWIVVTGLDGSGKTTLIDHLVNWFEANGKKVYRDRFPHDHYLTHELLNASEDPYTDRLLFALDNRISGTNLKKIINSKKYDIVITQRGFLDSFVHGAVKGYSYSWTNDLLQLYDMPKCDIMIHLVCQANIAYARICDDPDADKFEYPEYLRRQEQETRDAYYAVTRGSNLDLDHFKGCINFFFDTTEYSVKKTFDEVLEKLSSISL